MSLKTNTSGNFPRKLAIPLVALSFLLIAGASSAACATTPSPITATGTLALTGITSVKTADGNTISSFTFIETLTGSVVGTRTGSGTLIMHQDGTANARDCGTFVGTILGISGTALLCIDAQGTLASFTGHAVFTDGTGGLAGSHGEDSFSGGATGPTTFVATTTSGEFHFSP